MIVEYADFVTQKFNPKNKFDMTKTKMCGKIPNCLLFRRGNYLSDGS